MRVGVTGASGFIGRALVDALRAANHDVVLFVRPNGHRVSGPSISWNPAEGALNQQDLVDAGPFAAVVNLAGAGIGDRRWSAARKTQILHSRVRSTALLVDALNRLPVKPFLLNASAIGFYGSRGDEVLDEASDLGNGFLAEVCAAWEREAERYRELGGRVAIARTGIVLDHAGGALKRQLPLFRAGLGGRLGNGQQWVSPISLLDEVRALSWIVEHEVTGTFNLCSTEPLRNTTLTELLGDRLNRPTRAHVPAIALRAVLGAEMASELLLSSQRVVPSALVAQGFHFVHAESADLVTYALRS
ncbi:MAG: TIGR01777 family oxidoreductase [Acidobacteriota bacterium]|nr:TIGR01777 family oxidoreductase [Acidobacteriota bacterium]MDE3043473.1 TIGR01777 family oxidoreductase [Acidobacteriota bacterium]MDE3221853.1 TIGR01777 family oxidoreductase [Acidobacteriota bacterium]